MEIKIDCDTLKSPLGILVAVLVIGAALGWMHLRRASLIEQGTAEIVRYLETEFPAEYMRRLQGNPDPERLEQLRQVEIVSLTPSWFFRADRDDTVRVKAIVQVGNGEQRTMYFRFKRVLGSWRLQYETYEPLFDLFPDGSTSR